MGLPKYLIQDFGYVEDAVRQTLQSIDDGNQKQGRHPFEVVDGPRQALLHLLVLKRHLLKTGLTRQSFTFQPSLPNNPK